MSALELTPKEIEVIEALRSDVSKTQSNMKRLNRIYNRVNNLTYEYCNCDKVERAVFYNFFYGWYDKKTA